MAAHGIADEIHQRHGEQTAHERESLDGENRQRQENRQHRAQRRAARYAENVRRHQRIAKHVLVHRAGTGKRSTDDDGRDYARAAQLKEDRLGRERQTVRRAGEFGPQQCEEIGNAQRVATDAKRNQREGEQGCEGENQDARMKHERMTGHQQWRSAWHNAATAFNEGENDA